MSKRDDIRRIWSECFNDSPEYVDMYFSRVYDDADGMTLEKNGKIVSSLLLQRYSISFHGSELPVSYVAGAATRRNARGKGYMSELMVEALYASAERGDMLCTLIPAHDWLYFYYDRFSFSTVFYVDAQRFTSFHTFPVSGSYKVVDDPYAPEVYRAFERMERERGGAILHSGRDFLNIFDDLRLDTDGRMAVMADDEDRIVSMAWGVVRDDMVVVNELLGDDADARTAALRRLRELYGPMPFKVLAPASENEGSRRKLYARGMARVVNVMMCLEAMASAHPEWKCAIKVRDDLMPFNSHFYFVDKGRVAIDDEASATPDLDLDIDVFNKVVFSSPQIGQLLRVPSVRPHMALMLD